MAQELLGYATLSHFAGGEEATIEFDRLIRLAAEDCAKRPEIDSPRKVLLQINLEPDGDGINVSAATKHSFPPQSSPVARAVVDKTGKLFANPESADDPNQRTLDEQE